MKSLDSKIFNFYFDADVYVLMSMYFVVNHLSKAHPDYDIQRQIEAHLRKIEFDK